MAGPRPPRSSVTEPGSRLRQTFSRALPSTEAAAASRGTVHAVLRSLCSLFLRFEPQFFYLPGGWFQTSYAATLCFPSQLYLWIDCVPGRAWEWEERQSGKQKQVWTWGAWVGPSVERPTWAQVTISRCVEFEPRVGLWADSSEPGACFAFCVSLPYSYSVSFSLSKINIKKGRENPRSECFV